MWAEDLGLPWLLNEKKLIANGEQQVASTRCITKSGVEITLEHFEFRCALGWELFGGNRTDLSPAPEVLGVILIITLTYLSRFNHTACACLNSSSKGNWGSPKGSVGKQIVTPSMGGK